MRPGELVQGRDQVRYGETDDERVRAAVRFLLLRVDEDNESVADCPYDREDEENNGLPCPVDRSEGPAYNVSLVP